MHRLTLLAPLFLLAACGQKGPLYHPDEGVPVEPQSSPAAAVPPAGTPSGDGARTVSPTAPASPDRSDEARKRVPRTPAPAEAR